MSFHDFAMCFSSCFPTPKSSEDLTNTLFHEIPVHPCMYISASACFTDGLRTCMVHPFPHKPLYVFLFVSFSGVRFRLSVVQVCLLFARLVGLNAPTCQSWNLSISFAGLGKCSHDDTKASCTWVRGSYLCGSSQLLKAWIIKKLRALHTSCWKCSWSSLAMSFTTLGFQHGEQFPCQWRWSILKFWTHILDCSHDDT